jgi:hypothetical protein
MRYWRVYETHVRTVFKYCAVVDMTARRVESVQATLFDRIGFILIFETCATFSLWKPAFRSQTSYDRLYRIV